VNERKLLHRTLFFVGVVAVILSSGCADFAPVRPTSDEVSPGSFPANSGISDGKYGFASPFSQLPAGIGISVDKDASLFAERIAQEVTCIPGVAQVEAVVVGRTAFVGIVTSPEKEDMSTRVRAHLEMRFPRTDVRVTAENHLVHQISVLAERLQQGEDPRVLYPEFDALGRALSAGKP